MTMPSNATIKDSSYITITKNTTALAIQITSQSNLSGATRGISDVDTSLITTNNQNYVVLGSCNADGRQVTVLLDSNITIATTNCIAGVFSVTVDNTNWSNATSGTGASKILGAHKLTAKLDNLGGNNIESSVYVFKSTNPIVKFSTDIVPLLTIPRIGNTSACIDCHFLKIGSPLVRQVQDLAHSLWVIGQSVQMEENQELVDEVTQQ